MKNMLFQILNSSKRRKAPYEVLIPVIIMIAGLFFPAVNYTHNGAVYKLNGFHLMTGVKIAGGTISLPPNGLLWIMMVGIIILFVLSFTLYKKHKALCALAMIACATSLAFVTILFTVQVESFLNAMGAKRVGALYGYLFSICGSCLTVLDALFILYQENKISGTFDIAACAFTAVASLSLPFGTYTYKKVSHPYIGFDMMYSKEIASDSFADASFIPFLLIACAVVTLSLSVKISGAIASRLTI